MSDTSPEGAPGGSVPDRVLRAATRDWMDPPGLAGVVAVAAGFDGDQPTIDVYVTAAADARQLPETLEGYPVRVRPSGGEVDALGLD